MANNRSTSGSTNAPGAGSNGTTSGANATGIGPAAVIRPPNGFAKIVGQLVFGVTKDIPAGAPITVAGVQMTQEQILAILQPVLDGFTAIADAMTAVKQRRLSLSALLPQAHLFVENLKVAVTAQFGKGSPILKDFGIKDGSARRKASVATKSAALVKGGETRSLRNTVGKAKRRSVKFTGQVLPASAVKADPTSGGAGGATGK